MVSFCSEDKVVTSRSKTVVVTVELWKELLQDMMLIVLDSVKQTFVGVFRELDSSGVTIAVQAEPNTSPDERFDALFVGSSSEPPPCWRGVQQLGQHYCSVLCLLVRRHIYHDYGEL